MDTFFLSHGAPMLCIDETIPARSFFQSWLPARMTNRPGAILIVSGHWETDVPTVNVVHGTNDTIYVSRYDEKAPYGKVAHPTPEHFYPLHTALGAAGDDSRLPERSSSTVAGPTEAIPTHRIVSSPRTDGLQLCLSSHNLSGCS
jgi:aromatic ring-opening dioxygenase catalytic subunit (LigB family)